MHKRVTNETKAAAKIARELHGAKPRVLKPYASEVRVGKLAGARGARRSIRQRQIVSWENLTRGVIPDGLLLKKLLKPTNHIQGV